MAAMTSVLGIDVASSSWEANGAALIELDETTLEVRRVAPGALPWPTHGAPTATKLADEIDRFARRHGVHAVALDPG